MFEMDLDIFTRCVDLCSKVYTSSSHNIDGVTFLVVEINQEIYISFKGSDGLLDWLTNFSFWSTKVNDIYIHSGFLQSFIKIKDTLDSIISEKIMKRNMKHIYFTGHSSGGSLASICGYMYGIGHVVTFGSPRVGCSGFVEKLNEIQNVHFQSMSDWVVILPCYLSLPKNCIAVGKVRECCCIFQSHGIEYYQDAISCMDP